VNVFFPAHDFRHEDDYLTTYRYEYTVVLTWLKSIEKELAVESMGFTKANQLPN